MPCDNFDLAKLPFSDRITGIREGYVYEPYCDELGALGMKGACARLGELAGQQGVLFCPSLSLETKQQVEEIIGATEKNSLQLLGIEKDEQCLPFS